MRLVIPSAKALIIHRHKFLILKQNHHGQTYWDLPGGKMEFGESPIETLKREVKEETFLEIKIKKLMGVWWFFTLDQKRQIVCLTYLCSAFHPEKIDLTQNPAQENIIDYDWISQEEFLSGKYNFLHQSLNSLIEKLCRR